MHRLKIANVLLPVLFMAVGCSKQEKATSFVPTLPVVEINSTQVPLSRDFVGQVYGYIDIPIRTRVDGYLEKIHFKEGGRVNRGDKLYSLDRQPFEANVARMQSELAAAKTQLAKAESDLSRVKPLSDIKAVSTAELDGAKAAYDAAVASVEAATANLRIARIELGYTTITSPISGIIGKSEVEIGEYVGRSLTQSALNTISRTDSIKVEFFITENDYLELARYDIMRERQNKEGNSNPEAGNNTGTLELVFSDNTVYDYPGDFVFANREIDASTGALLIQASFPNPDNLIKPGQFAKVRVTFKTNKPVVLIPQRSIREVQGNFSVFRVENDTAKEVFIEKGPNYQDYSIVRSGLKDGDKIILEGLQKVRNGAPVNSEQVKFDSKGANNG